MHDDATAESLGLAGAPIEGPTHFSQIDPLAVAAWGPAWFERGCVSAHFRTMVVEGEEVQASLVLSGDSGRIDAVKRDGSAVLTGTASIGPEHQETELQRRMDSLGDPGELYIIDRLSIGETRQGTHPLRITRAERRALSEILLRLQGNLTAVLNDQI